MPNWDNNLQQTVGGQVDEDLTSFLEESVAKHSQKDWVEAYPVPRLPAHIPTNMDMAMRLLVPSL